MNYLNKKILLMLVTIACMAAEAKPGWNGLQDPTSAEHIISSSPASEIKPYAENPWYWEYQGEPILLRGGSDNDNLWQWTGTRLTEHLDLLVSVGGNYVRNTMSDRDEGDTHAFQRLKNGKYDLDQWNDEYWGKLEFFLNETSGRGIIAQLTLWDWFDLAGDRFATHPLNPDNNINWESGLIETRDDFYGGSLSNNNEKVLDLQKKYVDRLLSLTFKYDNILYNVSNESSLGSEWENYWAEYLKGKAEEAGKEIHITSMQLVPSNGVRHVMTYDNLYSFAEISQNNQDSKGGRGKAHWDNIMYWRSMIEASPKGPMPMNNEKIYGSGEGNNYSAGSRKEAEDRMWKNVFAGAASVRFHRPEGTWGIGLSDRAQINLKALDMLLAEMDIFSAAPYLGCKPITGSEGYAIAIVGKQYAVYLPAGRYSVELDPWVYAKEYKVKYLDIDECSWSEEETVTLDWEEELSADFGFQRGISLTSKSNRPYVVLVEVVR